MLKIEFENLSNKKKFEYLLSKKEEYSKENFEFKDYQKICFVFRNKDVWIGFDNRDGRCVYDEFESKEEAERWLVDPNYDEWELFVPELAKNKVVIRAHKSVAHKVIVFCERTIALHKEGEVVDDLKWLKQTLIDCYFGGKYEA